MLRRCAPFIIPLLLLLVLPVAPVWAQEDEVEDLLPALYTGSARLVRDGRELPLPMTETVLGPLFSLPDLMQALGGELRKGPLGQSFHMQLFDEEVVIGVGSHVMTVGQDIVRLSQPPRLGTGGLQVPLDLVTKTLGEALHYDFVWSQVDRRLFAMPQEAHDVEVAWNLVHLQGISTLVVQFSERPRYRIEEGDTFVLVELLGGERAVVNERRPPADPLVSGVFFEGSAIRIRKTPGAIVEHYEQDRPFRLVFDLYQRQETRVLPGTTPTPTRRLIVLDPGHGGSESGAIGPSGVEEKALTLQLARTLARRLETRLPVRVVLTRDE
ncbi:MAG: N-acetylmuramoyl-L-alanine amidase, partial [Thermoanaerobaculia bacterium]|nr:N-acetylmuramoyl-L-alanine amidase [Thermoanaerobaculia bacterium]